MRIARSISALVPGVLALSLLAAPTRAHADAHLGRALTAPRVEAPPRETRPHEAMIVTGMLTLVLAYLADGGAAAGLWASQGDSEAARDRFFFGLVPLIGPWVQLANEPDLGWRIFFGVDGGVQLLAVGLAALAHLVREEVSGAPTFALVPVIGPDRLALVVRGDLD